MSNYLKCSGVFLQSIESGYSGYWLEMDTSLTLSVFHELREKHVTTIATRWQSESISASHESGLDRSICKLGGELRVVSS